MNVLLLQPPVHHYAGFQYRMLPTLGLPTIAGVLNRAGHRAEVQDLEALGVGPERMRSGFEAQRDRWPDVVGMTCLTITAPGVQDTIAALREAGFTGRIAVGGVHPTLEPQEALSWGADLVVTGECEGNIAALLESGAAGIQAGQAAPMDDIPLPDWTHHNPPIASYWANMAILRPNPGIAMWTRGCPFQCIYCGNAIYGGQKTRYFTPERIEADMRDIHARGSRRVFVYDDEMVGTRLPDGWMPEIADRLHDLADAGAYWITQGRCSQRHITPELMRDMKRAGCRAVFWGVESFSDKVLREIRKGQTADDIWHTLRVAHEAGIENGAFTMIGNYGETEEDLAVTRDALGKAYREGLIQYRQTTVCTAMPGTELKRRQEAEGWYVEAPKGGMQMLQVHNETPWLNRHQIELWQRRFAEACPAPIDT